MKWNKPKPSKAVIYAPGIPADVNFVQGFELVDRLDTHCRAYLFIDQRTNEHEMGITVSEIHEKVKQLRHRIPGVILTSESLNIHEEGVIQLILDELENVEASIQEALQSVLKQSKGIVIGLYRTKGGVGIHTLARLLQLHLRENKMNAHVIAREDRYEFQSTPVNQMPGKVDQAKGMYDTVIVCEPTPSTLVDRKVLIADQTDVSVKNIKEIGSEYDCIVINRFNPEVIPQNVFQKAVGIESLLFIHEDLGIRAASMMGVIEEVPTSLRAELQAMYM